MRAAILVSLFLCSLSTARAEEGSRELAFFTEGGVFLHHHFSGPMSASSEVWVRRDGHVLRRRKASPTELVADQDLAPGASGEPGGWSWAETSLDAAAVQKLERLARQSQVCLQRSTDGFSVGGAWVVGVDLGPHLRCSLRRRARLAIAPGVRVLIDALTAAVERSGAQVLARGRRADGWQIPPELASR